MPVYNFFCLNNVRSLSSFDGVVSLSLFNLRSYGILVNLCCTSSSFDIPFTMCGDHATMVNSKCGITYYCIFGFPRYTHAVCWWRLAIFAGASHMHASFSLTPEN